MGGKRPGSRGETTRLNFRGETTRGETTRGKNGLGAKRLVTIRDSDVGITLSTRSSK